MSGCRFFAVVPNQGFGSLLAQPPALGAFGQRYP
jgi:hypothetical protein